MQEPSHPRKQAGLRAHDAPSVPWHALLPEAVLERLSSAPQGLTEEAARERLARQGPNVLERSRPDSAWKLLWRQIDNPLIWVLIASAGLAILLGKVTDGLVVAAVVVLNTLIGFVQEYRAGRAIEALNHMVPETAQVLRDGHLLARPAAELVPGDVVQLASGDRVPADLRLLRSRNFQVEEAALTGESVPSSKHVTAVSEDAELGDRASLAFGGTLVTSGTSTAVVVATGSATELGRISHLMDQAADLSTPLTRELARLGRVISAGIVVLSAVLLGVGMFRGYAFSDAVLVAITLAVAAIPEGLPAIVTIALAIGVQRMASRRAVIRKLPAVETLGSTTVICTDKTGTLTRNEMTVQALWTWRGHYVLTGVGHSPLGDLLRAGRPLDVPPDDVRALLVAGVLCNEADLQPREGRWGMTGDPTEGALLFAAKKAGLGVTELRERHPRLDAIPFESEHQFMAALHAGGPEHAELFMKGAPEVVLRRCGPETDRDAVLAEVERMARQGLRVLAFARKHMSRADALRPQDVEDGFALLGLQGMIDPPREEAVASVRACHAAGIRVKMMTGDHPGTAEAIGLQLGLHAPGHPALTGARLSGMSDAELALAVKDTHVFARLAPEHKLRLVRALQAQRHVVAMTGDGVNDAPALKQADIGVAMGITGTAVSREAADLVLTDDNFATIVAAVEEGRRVYDNLVKSLAFVLPTNLGLALILMLGVTFFPLQESGGVLEPLLAMRPTQLLWINLVATVTLALPLAFEAKERHVMRRPPRSPDTPVLSHFVVMRTGLVALLMTAGAIGLFLWEFTRQGGTHGVPNAWALAEARTMAVNTVVSFQIFYLWLCRTLTGSTREVGFASNPTVFVGIAALVLLQAAFMYVPFFQRLFGSAPLSLGDIARSVLVGACVLPVVGLEKWLRSRRRETGRSVSAT
ncbi:HAD-IC family P-type ATPase [Corallococcus exiguus]|uniref:cation-translocating P-type ATPase n=1 Tax=Corallococcus TaxID=83461 RepID=UPI000ED97164|nr:MULTISPECIES: HAD-IC family P-type ATPase [Corallococcus]NNB88677.1 HAD-IC family P-type ATPase [Corallococcus exiguus]NNC03340.1 HAD-IC family P-type ATPase [Corallococcus exiguus]NPC49182.1 HAD-IC family P-type ATPase [Corallococcus exiguus]RKH85999.1 HAD family hydrolase [Corallococcus sp. AB032C]